MSGSEITSSAATFQLRVNAWVETCFSAESSKSPAVRNHRFLEEALELVQACGCTEHEAYQLVEYVFNRPMGEKAQEVGGTMLTLAALCTAHELDININAETELSRVWRCIKQIRAKDAAKPDHSPLPQLRTP